MTRDWRAQWGQGDFPFLYVQIANFRSTDDWPTVREAQLQTLALKNTGMAVTIDIGDTNFIHPMDKEGVGRRLALWARNLSYGEQVEDSGLLFQRAISEGNQMRIWFDHAEEGLTAKNGTVKGFEVANFDGKFYNAEAKLNGKNVTASSVSVTASIYVRYGWASNPRCTLYNKVGLPASPFTSQQ